MNTAYTLADYSRDHPTRERPGVKTRSGLCQCSALGKIDQGKFCSLQSGATAGLTVDSAPRSSRGCRPPGPLHQVSSSVFLLLAPGPLGPTPPRQTKHCEGLAYPYAALVRMLDSQCRSQSLGSFLSFLS